MPINASSRNVSHVIHLFLFLCFWSTRCDRTTNSAAHTHFCYACFLRCSPAVHRAEEHLRDKGSPNDQRPRCVWPTVGAEIPNHKSPAPPEPPSPHPRRLSYQVSARLTKQWERTVAQAVKRQSEAEAVRDAACHDAQARQQELNSLVLTLEVNARRPCYLSPLLPLAQALPLAPLLPLAPALPLAPLLP